MRTTVEAGAKAEAEARREAVIKNFIFSDSFCDGRRMLFCEKVRCVRKLSGQFSR